MMITAFRPIALAAAAIMLTLGLAACAADAPADPGRTAAAADTADADDAAGAADAADAADVADAADAAAEGSAGGASGAPGGRAFDASRGAVIKTIEIAFKSKNASATWNGDVLEVSLDGKADTVTASIPCRAVEAVIADGESVVLVYPDGTVDCAEHTE